MLEEDAEAGGQRETSYESSPEATLQQDSDFGTICGENSGYRTVLYSARSIEDHTLAPSPSTGREQHTFLLANSYE